MKKRVAVVGAGSSGLVCLKELIAEGHTVVAYECRREPGGIFRSSRYGGRAYDSMRLTSSNYVTAFSDYPPREREPCHWRHDQYLSYLQQYATHHDLLRHVRFETRVERIERVGERWRVRSVGPAGQQVDTFDAIAVCSGIVHRPHIPAMPDQERFRGEIIHSSSYHNAVPFTGKRVVIVGGGETAADICNEIAQTATKCHVSQRNGQWVLPRLVRGSPNDFHTSRVLHGLPRPLLDELSLLRARAHLTAARLPVLGCLVSPSAALRSRLLLDSGRGVFSQFAVKSDEMIRPLLERKITRHGGVERLVPDGVVFADGARVEADVVLLCTGYHQGFAFMDDLPVDFGRLYHRCFSPALGPSVAFIGFARPAIGAIPPIAEMQARWFALVCSGRRTLPPAPTMEQVALTEQATRRRQFGVVADRLESLVDYTPYQDTLADEIGCRPDLARLAVTDPRRAWKLFAGPFVGAQFRLVGPHADPVAARETLDRVRPVLTAGFIAFLIVCHVVTRLLAALGLKRFAPALRLRAPHDPGHLPGADATSGDTAGLGRFDDRARTTEPADDDAEDDSGDDLARSGARSSGDGVGHRAHGARDPRPAPT